MIRYLTKRLELREARGADADEASAYYLRNRDFLAPWEPLHGEEFFTSRGQRSLIRVDRRGFARGQGLRLWIYRTDDAPQVPIGNIALSNIVRGAFLSCYLGYRLDANAAGKGYMTEAVEQMVRVAFGRLKLHRVEANVMPRNLASIRVLEKCGFLREGFSPSYLRINGVWEDHYHYVMLSGIAESTPAP